MGLIDQILSGATGEAQRTAARNPIANVQMVMELIHGFPGGVQGVLQKLAGSGLEAQVQSWIGSGANQRVSADQVMHALGPEQMQRVAQKFGVDQELAANSIADLLPGLVDQLTPGGRMDADTLSGGLAQIRGLLPEYSSPFTGKRTDA
jgi:uncharacterized protein YidB (DUF937 family)